MIASCTRSGLSMGPFAACPVSAVLTEAAGLAADTVGQTSAPAGAEPSGCHACTGVAETGWREFVW